MLTIDTRTGQDPTSILNNRLLMALVYLVNEITTFTMFSLPERHEIF